MKIKIDFESFKYVNGVLIHLIFATKAEMNNLLGEISYNREGTDKTNREQYIGHNFPLSYLIYYLENIKLDEDLYKKLINVLDKYLFNLDEIYVIGYIKKDLHTLSHELYHAKYFFDKNHRQYVEKLWKSLSYTDRQKIEKLLEGYKPDFHLDEFQAYLFTDEIKLGVKKNDFFKK